MRGFTLLELVVVLIIVGVLGTISFVHYGVYQEKSLDSEAEANLALIIAAERVYRMERNVFYINVNEPLLNQNLRLFLPTAANRKWAYQTVTVGVNCCAQATRIGGPLPRSWRLCTNSPTNRLVAGTCTVCP